MPHRRVRVRYRLWRQGAWVTDRYQTGGPDPDAWFDLERSPTPGTAGDPLAASPPDLRPYLSYLREDTGYIEVRGLSTGAPQAHRYPIGELYIELQSAGAADPAPARAAARDATYDDGTPASERGADHPLCAALANPRLVISGDPGCGKTTFLRWVAQCLSVDRLDTPGQARRHLGLAATPLPILVRIGQWQDFIDRRCGTPEAPQVPDSPEWLPAFLGAHAAEHGLVLDAADFRQLLQAGAALILLDGLDEAPDRRQRAAAARIIEHAALTWPKCPLVVTSRLMDGHAALCPSYGSLETAQRSAGV